MTSTPSNVANLHRKPEEERHHDIHPSVSPHTSDEDIHRLGHSSGHPSHTTDVTEGKESHEEDHRGTHPVRLCSSIRMFLCTMMFTSRIKIDFCGENPRRKREASGEDNSQPRARKAWQGFIEWVDICTSATYNGQSRYCWWNTTEWKRARTTRSGIGQQRPRWTTASTPRQHKSLNFNMMEEAKIHIECGYIVTFDFYSIL